MLLFLFKSIFQTNGLIEDEMVWRGIGVDIEVADALELQVSQSWHILDELLNIAIR